MTSSGNSLEKAVNDLFIDDDDDDKDEIDNFNENGDTN